MMVKMILALMLFSAVARASDVAINSVATSDDIYACNLSLNAVPSAETPGSILGALTYENLAAANNSPGRIQTGGYALTLNSPALFSTSSQWLTRFNSLSLAFSTETMGVGYNLHVCLRGPLKSNSGQGRDKSEKIYSLAASVFHSSGVYANTAKLYYRVLIQCDLRDVGNRRNARGNNELSPNGSMEIDYSYLTNWAAFNGSLRVTEVEINKRTQQVPRFCEVVFQFKEASTDLRPNQQQATEFNLGVDLF